MKSILITRNKGSASDLERYLQNQGFTTFVEPLFVVENVKFVKPLKKPDFVIITSANACDALLQCGFAKDIKIYVVGKITAKKLDSLDFVNVVFLEESSARALKNLISRVEKNTNGLYLRGEIINSDLAQELAISGFAVEEIMVYKTKVMDEFSQNLLEVSKSKKFESVLIFSKNSAKIFYDLARKHNLLEYFAQSQILCFSKQILDEINKLGFKKAAIFSDFPFLRNFYE